jgi:hypothetical protein
MPSRPVRCSPAGRLSDRMMASHNTHHPSSTPSAAIRIAVNIPAKNSFTCAPIAA